MRATVALEKDLSCLIHQEVEKSSHDFNIDAITDKLVSSFARDVGRPNESPVLF